MPQQLISSLFRKDVF